MYLWSDYAKIRIPVWLGFFNSFCCPTSICSLKARILSVQRKRIFTEDDLMTKRQMMMPPWRIHSEKFDGNNYFLNLIVVYFNNFHFNMEDITQYFVFTIDKQLLPNYTVVLKDWLGTGWDCHGIAWYHNFRQFSILFGNTFRTDFSLLMTSLHWILMSIQITCCVKPHAVEMMEPSVISFGKTKRIFQQQIHELDSRNHWKLPYLGTLVFENLRRWFVHLRSKDHLGGA